MSTLLIIILMLNVFIIGAITPMAVRYAQAHFGGKDPSPEPQKPEAITPSVQLPEATKAHILHDSQAKYQSILEKSAAKFEHDLQSTAGQIDNLVKHLATEIVGNELEQYRTELARLRKQAETDMSTIKKDLDKHKTELQAGNETRYSF